MPKRKNRAEEGHAAAGPATPGRVRTTPFHERLSTLNATGLYTHWQGTLSARRYSHAPKHEYFAVRNSVGIFDTSPLYKYRVTGPDAERFLAGVAVRDVRTCRPGRAQYTILADDRGFVAEDGVLFRVGDDDFLLTAARPNLGYLLDLAEHGSPRLSVEVADETDDHGILAVQGPRSRVVLAELTPVVSSLRYFAHAPATVAGAEVMVSRTGFTGDLGFELTVPAGRALDVLDAVLASGRHHGMRPFGEEALDMLRIEAGLPLVDVEFTDSRTAWSDTDRVTPTELGMGWMLGDLDSDRPFVGREALRRERDEKSSRWASVGVVVDSADWARLHRAAGYLPPKSEHPLPYESVLYSSPLEGGERARQVGYVTSFFYSPVLQRHVGLARVEPDRSLPGTEVHLELALAHRTTSVLARTAALPLFDPARKVATP